MRRRVSLAAAALAPITLAAVVWAVSHPVDTTLEFRVVDAVSGGWVYGAAIRLQDRFMLAHFQSDHGAVPQRFTRLKPGPATIEVSAPHYLPQSVAVTLRRGANVLETPIEMVGYEIPDLSHWVLFPEQAAPDLVSELRPVSRAGSAVLDHPRLDIRVLARVTVQTFGGRPARERTEEGAERGLELFAGFAEVAWDAAPETSFRYRATIPGARIRPNADPWWVIDYLIVVPDPRRITEAEVDEALRAVLSLAPSEVEALLAPYRAAGRLIPYTFTAWNVPGISS